MCVFKEETMLCISSLVGTKEKMVSYVSPPSYGLRHYLIINLSNLIPPLHNRNQHSTFRTEKKSKPAAAQRKAQSIEGNKAGRQNYREHTDMDK